MQIKIGQKTKIKYDDNFIYYLNVAQTFQIIIQRFQETDIFLFSCLMHLI